MVTKDSRTVLARGVHQRGQGTHRVETSTDPEIPSSFLAAKKMKDKPGYPVTKVKVK
jgi:hypothetical protein